MRRKYNPLNNNCQMFCQKLLMCINIPSTVNELQSDYMKLPLTIQEDVMSQRHTELVPRLYQQILDGTPLAFPGKDKHKILPVERLAIGTKAFLIIITTALFWGEFHLRLYFLMCLCASDLLGSGGACHLTKLGYFDKRKWKPYGKYRKEFNELIDEMVLAFYRELEGETAALPELSVWEPQLNGALRSYVRM